VGAPPSPGGRETLGLDEPELGEAVELDRDLGLRELDGLAELRPGGLSAVPQQPEKARLVTVLGPCPDSVHRRLHVHLGWLSDADTTSFGLLREDFVQRKF
jgi:hypothetical protein